MQVVSQVPEELKTQDLRKIQNNVKTSWNHILVPSLPPKKKLLSILAKDFLKIEIELFPQGTISHENYSFPQIFFVRACTQKDNKGSSIVNDAIKKT